MQPKLRHEPTQGLFIADVGGVEASLTYARRDETTVDFQSTFVPHTLRNQYLGTQLVRYALAWARDNKQKVVPTCWFCRMIMDREPEWKELRAD